MAMPLRVIGCTAAFLLLHSSLAFAAPARGLANEALTKKYCVGCHNDKLRVSDFSLEHLDARRISADSAVWEKVLRRVSANEMPPSGMPRPDASTLKAFTSRLENELDRAAAAHPNPGHPTIHRLNRNEYSNAVRDLFALDINPGSKLPLDDTGYGFDNIGDVLSLSPVLIERYMTTGRLVARLAIGDTDIKPVVDTFAAPRGPESLAGLSFDYRFPLDAEYVFRIKLPGDNNAPPARYVEVRVPVKAGSHRAALTFTRSEAPPDPETQAGSLRSAVHMEISLDGGTLKTFELIPKSRGPSFNELSIAGPYNVTGPGNTPSRQRIFVCTPANAADEEPCAQKILSAIGRRAYRRPFTEADLKPLMAFYQAGRAEKNFNYGVEFAVRALLVSPDFLFRVEHDPAGSSPGSVHRIDGYELAARLSFFLWSSIPDDQLLDLAGQGRLADPVVVAQQVTRMLNDSKSKAFVSNFAGQWLYLRNLDQVKPDPKIFPQFDGSLRQAFRQETQLFFNSVLRNERPVTELLDAKYTFLNQRLAEFYGLPDVTGPEFRRVEITDPRRGGLLTQGSILTVTSYPNRTSVVQRGKWVLENLLGTPPPPPPANVPSLDAHGKDGKLSARQAMEMHRANPVCASCHSRMDPIGFALENYNGIGQWRDQDNGLAIDTSGQLPDGSAFEGAEGLRRALLSAHKEEFVTTVTEKLMTYALGRGIEPFDRPAIRSVIREAAKQNTTIPALIRAIVASEPFQMRAVPDAGAASDQAGSDQKDKNRKS